MADSPVLYSFTETKVFSKRLKELASFETLAAIQADLLAEPTRWPVVKGTHGARKGRIADPQTGRGKSGSFRYLYLFLEHKGRIYLLFLFGKSEQSNLSPEQTKEVAQLVDAIKEESK
jgi:mRNA-degrading endonuclease RelE of RelBE toxin-antitoxin system